MPDKLNLYLQSSPSVGIAHSTLSCERRCYGLRTSLSTSFNPCPRPLIGQECWVFEGACVRLRHLVISPVWVDFRPVASGGAGGAIAPPVFGQTVNPNSTRGADYVHHSNTSPPGFSDLATALDLLGLLTCWVVVPLILLLWLRSLRLEQATG